MVWLAQLIFGSWVHCCSARCSWQHRRASPPLSWTWLHQFGCVACCQPQVFGDRGTADALVICFSLSIGRRWSTAEKVSFVCCKWYEGFYVLLDRMEYAWTFKVYIQQRGEHVVVRVGGGYKSLQAHQCLLKYGLPIFASINIDKVIMKWVLSCTGVEEPCINFLWFMDSDT